MTSAFSPRRSHYATLDAIWISCECPLVQLGGVNDTSSAAWDNGSRLADLAGLRFEPEAALTIAMNGGEPYAVWA